MDDDPRPTEPLAFDIVDPADADATWALQHYFAELDARFDGGFDAAAALDEGAPGMRGPHGAFVVARRSGRVVGCGGVQRLDSATHEIKRMWIHPDERGAGVGRRLLTHLEGQCLRLGSARVVLDTNSALTEAIAMYARAGYRPIERYNDNPYARHWFEKRLTPAAPSDIHVRRLASGDGAAARRTVELMTSVFDEGGDDPLSDTYIERLLARTSLWILAASLDDEIVGGLTAHELPMTRDETTELFIYDLAVAVAHQRRGVGRRLVETLLADGATAGIDVVFVPADDDDTHALDFYRALGGAGSPVTIFDLGRRGGGGS